MYQATEPSARPVWEASPLAGSGRTPQPTSTMEVGVGIGGGGGVGGGGGGEGGAEVPR